MSCDCSQRLKEVNSVSVSLQSKFEAVGLIYVYLPMNLLFACQEMFYTAVYLV